MMRKESDKQYREKAIELIRNYMGYYKPEMKLPTLTYKKIQDYKEPIGYDVLCYTLINVERDITWALTNKNFNSETAKIMYLFAIVQNHYMEEYRKKVAEKRKSYSETDPNEMITNDKNRKQNIKDIRKWLDED